MGSSGCRARRTDKSTILIGLLLAQLGIHSACTSVQAPQPPVATEARATTSQASPSPPSSPLATAYEVGVELPEGPGRDILISECLICHELGSLELFKDFYNRDSWRSLVVSMRGNGAEVDDTEIEVLSDYLAQHFGVGTP